MEGGRSDRCRREVPVDLDGIYLRNTENPLHPALKSYHPFDGDGMLHIVGFRDGKAFYRNRFVRTEAFEDEQQAGGPLWPGLAEPLSLARADHGWGHARCSGRVEHRRRRSPRHCADELLPVRRPLPGGSLHRRNPRQDTWNGAFPFDWGVSAHPKVDERTDEMLFFNYAKSAPYLHYGVVDADNDLVHYVDVPCQAPGFRTIWRSPATTRSSTTSRCSGARSYWSATCTCRTSTGTCRRVSR